MIVGEAAGEDEHNAGSPFVGKSGEFLNRLIGRLVDPANGLPLKREDFRVSNVLSCRPPDNKLNGAHYEYEAIRNCSPLLASEIRSQKPKVILALGNSALRWLTGRWGIDTLRGYQFPTQWGPVIGTYHPSYLIRGNFHLSRLFQHDLMKALASARGMLPQLTKHYQCDPPLMQFEQFIGDYIRAGHPPLAFDIETPHSDLWEKDEDNEAGLDEEEEYDADYSNNPSYTILRISFSYLGGRAISVPWLGSYIAAACRLLSLPGWKLVHNANFDVPRLRYNGANFGGPIVDGLDLWHYLEPSWPAGLKKIATITCPDMHCWKEDSKTNPAWYNAADSDVLLRTYEYVRSKLEKQGRWDSFQKQYIDLRVVLDWMSDEGIRTDPTVRREGREQFAAEYESTMSRLQEIIPIECRKLKVYRKGDEAFLKEEGKWVEGRMVPILVRMRAPMRNWYAVLDGQVVAKVKVRGQKKALRALSESVLKGATVTLVKPPALKRARKSPAGGAKVKRSQDVSSTPSPISTETPI